MGDEQIGPLSKICHTYSKMIKLDTVIGYLKKIQKIYESRNIGNSSISMREVIETSIL